MKKLFGWFNSNISFIFTLLLLVVIPLYPKLPLFDVKHTWVYVRVEDFLVLLAIGFAAITLIRHKVSLRTPLTGAIFLFWIVGAIATIHGALLIFPGLADVYPNVALLSFLRRVEYISLFFISYWGMKDKRFFPIALVVLIVTFILVVAYGLGQKYFGFPAFLTMNEEFAKGIPIRLSSLSRVSSTFGGHYDLAAYLVLVIPIIVSLIFAYRSWLLKGLLTITSILGFFVLFTTVSRISFLALFIALGVVFFVQKKRLIIVSLPIVGLLAVLFIVFSPSLLDRFGSTIKKVDVLVDAQSGTTIGHVREAPKVYFESKIVKQQFSRNITSLDAYASASAAIVYPYNDLPETLLLLTDGNAPTGEDLPQGTGYVNLSLSPIIKKIGHFYYERKPNPLTGSTEVFIINGNYLVKKAYAYDLSFTTRFQGEWPHALAAFRRNIFLGSGYGSVSLAVDNSYLRMLGEVGILGLISFLAILMALGIYIRKTLPNIDSPVVRSFIVGFAAGVIGLSINAIFIDVFEASKIAFLLWLTTGMVVGIASLYQRDTFALYKEVKRIILSPYAILFYLFLMTIVLFSPMTRNYFVGDDFTWFRWSADCDVTLNTSGRCPSVTSTIFKYFTDANGFFYRPGEKLYFYTMYQLFWLNQAAYHAVSLVLHFMVTALVFFLARKLLRDTLLAAGAGFLFLILSGYSEAVFWISATGFLFTAFFSVASLLCYIRWSEKKQTVYFIGTLILFICSLLFHELGIITPILFLLYQRVFDEPVPMRTLMKDVRYQVLFSPIPVYILLRFLAGSHWFSGDYNYNLLKLPFNALGNTLGYSLLSFVGQITLPLYQTTRYLLKTQMVATLALSAIFLFFFIRVYKKYQKRVSKYSSKILIFGVFFSIIALLPFLGLGNIASRYSYLSSIGMIFILVYGIKKLYSYLLPSGRDIAILGITAIVSVFSLLQIIQLQQGHSDWFEAGEKSKRFVAAMDSAYDDFWRTEPIELHFVNVPIRYGQAWVFPVGMSDALWFIVRNPSVKVYTWSTLEEAYNAVTFGSKIQKIFEFDDNGNITEKVKPPPVQ